MLIVLSYFQTLGETIGLLRKKEKAAGRAWVHEVSGKPADFKLQGRHLPLERDCT